MTFQSESEAVASGYRACKVCKPDQGSGPWQPKAVEITSVPMIRTGDNLRDLPRYVMHSATAPRVPIKDDARAVEHLHAMRPRRVCPTAQLGSL